jgi:AraC-like DNA-binding protein
VLTGRLVVRHLRGAEDKTSPEARAARFQVKFLAVSFFALWLIAACRYLLDLAHPASMQYTSLLLPLSATVFVYALAYLGLRKPETLVGAEERAPAPGGDAAAPPAKKYEKSTLTPERAEQYLARLLHVMETEKPYTDGDLTLPRLAARLSISTHHLSRVINERAGQNFFDFVNAYRVEEAKRRLADPSKKHRSLLAIAEEVGFNSKSAFNTAFKKHANMTPSDFRKACDQVGQR